MQHLRNAETLLGKLPQNPFDSHTVDHAQHEFVSALNSFDEIDAGLKAYPGISTWIPVYGPRLSAALHLVSLALGISQAGVASCAILNVFITKYHDPLNPSGSGLTTADFTIIDQNYFQVSQALHSVIAEANSLQPGDLQFDQHLAQTFSTYKKDVPALQTWLTSADKLVPILPELLGIGKPTNYLIEVLDSTELRPAGGFIGNYGIATLSGGRLASAHITDVDLLEAHSRFAHIAIPYPEAYLWFTHYLVPDSWSFRDSNLDADFPTAARYGELNYKREGGKIPVDGVIAITPTLIQQALAITGPIAVPEYHEVVTTQNLVARIHFHQLGKAGEGSNFIPSPDGHSSLRKRFTELLAEHFLARVRELPSSAQPRFLQLMISSLHSKDIQLYLNSSPAEDVLQSLQLDGAIQPSGSDSLFIVDANVSPNKANSFIVNTLNDQVTIDAGGNAIHHTTINYAWTIVGQNYGLHLYRDYVRVYVPTGSVLQSQSGWESQGKSEAFGHVVWAGSFTLVFGQTRRITLVWTASSVARKDANGWHYSYLLQRQAGKQEAIDIRIILPAGAVLTYKWGGLISSKKQVAMLSQTLSADLNVGIDYVE